MTAFGRGGFIRTEKEKNYLNFAAEKLLAGNAAGPVIVLTLCVATFPPRDRKPFGPRDAKSYIFIERALETGAILRF